MKILKISLIFAIILCISHTFSIAVNTDKIGNKDTINNEGQNPSQCMFLSFLNDTELIEEFTWAIMKYDCNWPSDNFGLVNMPTPDPGTILILADMMSLETCHIATSVYHEDKMSTLESLEIYDLDNMRVPFYASHPLLTMLLGNIAATTNLFPVFGIQKNTVNEMKLFGDIYPKGNLVGDCYSQAVLNTAILRLCGFSAEEVFTVLIPMHAVTIAKIEETWYVFDSVAGQDSGTAIYDIYPLPSFMQTIYALENDKYFINFGRGKPEIKPYLDNQFSNIDTTILSELLEDIIPLFSNASLGSEEIGLDDFIKNAVPCPEIATVGIPYTVQDGSGSTVEEKAAALASLNKAFISNHTQTGDKNPNQYDRSMYCQGILSVKYPQAYVNAARYGSWTSWFARLFDAQTVNKDIQRTITGINLLIKNRNITNDSQVFFSDFSYRVGKGSSIDKAIVAYGTFRNMKKGNSYWPPQDLHVMISENYGGYLAVNSSNGWRYIDFRNGNNILMDPPEHIKMTFNEIEYTFF